MTTIKTGCACGQAVSAAALDAETTRNAAEVFKAMGHPTRLTILEALKDGERCVCELSPILNGELSTISRHLSSLKNAGLIEDRREGQKIFYRLKMDCVSSFIACIADKVST